MEKIKLLEVIRDANGGMRKHVEALISDLDKETYDITLACSDNQFNLEEIEDKKIKFYLINLGNRNKLSILQSLLRLIAVIKKEKIQIIHAHGMACALIGTIASFFSGRPKIITTLHNFPNYNYITNWLLTRLIQHHSKVIVVSEALKNTVTLLWKIPESKVHVIYNGIDINSIACRAKQEQCGTMTVNTPIVLVVSRLIPQKGIDVFLKATALLIKELRGDPFLESISFKIAGDGPDLPRLKKIARELGIENYVEFLGFRKDIYGLIKASELIVLSSLSEGLGISLLEAMALKKPVIASRVGGIPEVIRDGVTGILVPPQDPESLSQAMNYILLNKPLAKRMGEEAFKCVSQNFLINTMLEKTNIVIKSTAYSSAQLYEAF